VILFRCWKCHRKYTKPDAAVGERFPCSCDNVLRVPKRSGGNCRVKTLVDRLVEAVVCGGGGALLAFGLAVLVLSRMPIRAAFFGSEWFVTGMTLGGGVLGALFGERAIDWIGQIIRDREQS
jgi:hypothetical protein